MAPIDLKGKKFSRLTVIEYDENSKKTGHAYWLCKCDCDKYKYVRSSHLTSGNVTSCGCRAREVSSKWLTQYANSKKHKGKGNPSWKGDNTKVAGIHNWLLRNFKKTKCEHCPSRTTLDWALKTGYNYSHKRSYFLVLCRSCHLKYDYKAGIRGKKTPATPAHA